MKFEESDGPVRVKDLFEAKAEMIRQEEKAPKVVGSGKAAIPTDEVPIAKVERNEANCSSTTKGSKERLGKSNGRKRRKRSKI